MSEQYDPTNPTGGDGAILNKIFYSLNNDGDPMFRLKQFNQPQFGYYPKDGKFIIDFYEKVGNTEAPHISLIIQKKRDYEAVTVIPIKVEEVHKDMRTLIDVASDQRDDLLKIIPFANTELDKIDNNPCLQTKGGGRRSRRHRRKSHKKIHKSHKKSRRSNRSQRRQ